MHRYLLVNFTSELYNFFVSCRIRNGKLNQFTSHSVFSHGLTRHSAIIYGHKANSFAT